MPHAPFNHLYTTSMLLSTTSGKYAKMLSFSLITCLFLTSQTLALALPLGLATSNGSMSHGPSFNSSGSEASSASSLALPSRNSTANERILGLPEDPREHHRQIYAQLVEGLKFWYAYKDPPIPSEKVLSLIAVDWYAHRGLDWRVILFRGHVPGEIRLISKTHGYTTWEPFEYESTAVVPEWSPTDLTCLDLDQHPDITVISTAHQKAYDYLKSRPSLKTWDWLRPDETEPELEILTASAFNLPPSQNYYGYTLGYSYRGFLRIFVGIQDGDVTHQISEEDQVS